LVDARHGFVVRASRSKGIPDIANVERYDEMDNCVMRGGREIVLGVTPCQGTFRASVERGPQAPISKHMGMMKMDAFYRA